jgi:hypothetical protein
MTGFEVRDVRPGNHHLTIGETPRHPRHAVPDIAMALRRGPEPGREQRRSGSPAVWRHRDDQFPARIAGQPADDTRNRPAVEGDSGAASDPRGEAGFHPPGHWLTQEQDDPPLHE